MLVIYDTVWHVNVTDNDIELGYNYANYQAAADQCEGQGSFIKWHEDSLCTSTELPEYWTSGTRHKANFVIRKACKEFLSQYKLMSKIEIL